MGSLTANLKQLYQCRIMCLYYIGLLFPTIPMVLEVATNSETSLPFLLPPMAGPLMFSFFYGTIVGSLTAELISKPFSFSLPKHFKTIRNMLFLIWFAYVLFFIFVLMVAYLAGANLLPYTSICLVGLMSLSYWLGAIVLTRARRVLMVFLIAILFLIASDIFETILATYPLALTLVCLILSLIIFYCIDYKGNARLLCITPRRSDVAFSSRQQAFLLQPPKHTKQNHFL